MGVKGAAYECKGAAYGVTHTGFNRLNVSILYIHLR
jgi:hypothetical protein